MPLEEYRRKRDFRRTPESEGRGPRSGHGRQFVVHKHQARQLHYDLRLETHGVLKYWAVPKGPSLDPTVKRRAVHVEDHPLEYGRFEGVIPAGEYGAGTIIVWDHGDWESLEGGEIGYEQGKLKFRLNGHKLYGAWMLVRLKKNEGETADNWLLIKERDAEARPETDYVIVDDMPCSTLTGTTIEEVAEEQRTGQGSRRPESKPPKPGVSIVGNVPGARAANMPRSVTPQLAKSASRVPESGRWLHEIKLRPARALSSHGTAFDFTSGYR